MNLRSLSRLLAIGSAAGLLATGCASDVTDTASPTGTANLGLTIGIDSGADIDGFMFDVHQVPCDDETVAEPLVLHVEGDLAEFGFPAVVPGFEGLAGHAFADHFFTLPAGCYDVSVTPRGDSDCSASVRRAVRVVDGETTEIMLLSQCPGGETGGLDVIAGVNHAPTITALSYQPSKFVQACVPVTVCATAMDPDGDDLEFSWELLGDADLVDGWEVVSNDRDGNTETECITLTGASAQSLELRVTVTDGMDDSSDDLSFPLYVAENPEGECDDILPPPECVEVSIEDLIQAGTDLENGCATIVVPEDACPVEITLSSFGLPSGFPRPYDEQFLFDTATATYEPGTYEVCVELPRCAYQADLFIGTELSSDVLIDFQVWAGPACGFPEDQR